MSLKTRLLEDMKAAMKDKQTIRKNTIQMVRAAILQVEKDKKVVLDDAGIIDVLTKEAKKRKDSLPDFEKSGRQDLIDSLNEEIEILMTYLPRQLTEIEVEDIVKSSIDELEAKTMKDMGRVMAFVTQKTKGIADGKLVSSLVKKYLADYS